MRANICFFLSFSLFRRQLRRVRTRHSPAKAIAQYHDALFKGLAKCDTDTKRTHDGSTKKYASPSKRKIAIHASTMQRQIELDQEDQES